MSWRFPVGSRTVTTVPERYTVLSQYRSGTTPRAIKIQKIYAWGGYLSFPINWLAIVSIPKKPIH